MFRENLRETIVDDVVEEYPVTIFLNDNELVTLLCTPEKLDYLALGFLRSEGFLEHKDQLSSLNVDMEKGIVQVKIKGDTSLPEKLYGRRTITTGCGKGTTFFNAWDSLKSRTAHQGLTVSLTTLHTLMGSLQAKAEVFRKTGGVHSAALAERDSLLFFCEDVGRHNALDKIVGECLWKEVNMSDKILISSGRLSSEMLLKAAKLQIPVLASRSAPTALGIDLAASVGITLVGFVRGKRATVYTCPERITAE